MRQHGIESKGVFFTTSLIASHDQGSTCDLVALLRPWIRRISARWLQTSSEFCGQEFKEIQRNIGSLETPKQVRIAR